MNPIDRVIEQLKKEIANTEPINMQPEIVYLPSTCTDLIEWALEAGYRVVIIPKSDLFPEL